jgi:hypothetical protein
MKLLRVPPASRRWNLQPTGLVAALLASLVLTACGGGGAAPVPEVPEAVVTQVQAEASVLEGSSAGASSDLTFLVSFDTPVVRRLEIRVSTVSAIKPGFSSTPGAAQGGSACGGDSSVDFLELQDQPFVFAAGASSGQITVKVCHDAVFEPNEVLHLTWKPVGGVDSKLKGVIINDDAGGLNGTGAMALLGGLPAFGRDVNLATNSNADGALGFSFESQADASCTLDKVTGLLWLNQWSASPFSTMGDLINSANRANNGAGLCGRTDWRVPHTNQLLSLLNFSVPINQAMNADAAFSQPMTGDFWTAQVLTGGIDNAWVVSPGQGGAVTYVSRSMSTPSVRLVSGEALEQPPRADSCDDAGARFKLWEDTRTPAVADGTVYDKKSGLMWKQCTEGDAGAQCTQASTVRFNTATSPDTTMVTYMANWVKNVNANASTLGSGYSDWRIPTVKELASLVDRCRSSPAINTTIFPNTMSGSYITSTVNANGINTFWYVDFFDGAVGVASPVGKYLRLVRAGQ